MARKKIREYDAKRLLKAHFARLFLKDLPINVAQVNSSTDFSELLQKQPWLGCSRLVVKPDMLFGQRGKHDLVGLNLSYSEAEAFIKQRLNKIVTVKGCSGPITTFVVEPFVPHQEEYYLCIQSDRLGYEIFFSEAGGMDVEENWDKVRSIKLDTLEKLSGANIAPLIASIPLEVKPQLEEFIVQAFKVYTELDMTLLEMNPFTLVPGPQGSGPLAFPLDMRVELDDTARFRSAAKWGDADFPLPFGRMLTPAEEHIAGLDEATGASLKFTVLNPSGRVWLMVAGGGASVIYADTVGDLGYSTELGNYGEYSGAPNTQETYQYAKTVLECVASNSDGRGRALLIGGGIANFTDVAATFQGIILALREKSEALKAAKVRIFVRRGGPNYQKGLELMRQLGKEIDIPIQVYGPESSMTGICAEAISYVKSFDG
mmetsp:Transcript_4518/g.9718  ORF Transcript_4518/g.9718 Transcript_4518/m.9718 type:complete len:431 (-) Transcript_4518:547-1839(-)|eukprot:CAMPEP_0202900006 /NCGR_PEP_ID=MMETSP1392-20130828/9376_1 /ASSEMBLY_ACC=CAM_ASM_000868 /TAXON_ID=225041 /ORGANISM="Chlamydomonas chlamydogama, Strain SAG 11-48b" /LENGTH=430 /DNA_ID=CAMNT_0049586315 /DNA_START=40 /DNA_END=1332 /DNA_ORIENTATION=+